MDISKRIGNYFEKIIRLAGNYMEGLVKEYANFLNDDKSLHQRNSGNLKTDKRR